jgi:hypothetical protein
MNDSRPSSTSALACSLQSSILYLETWKNKTFHSPIAPAGKWKFCFYRHRCSVTDCNLSSRVDEISEESFRLLNFGA